MGVKIGVIMAVACMAFTGAVSIAAESEDTVILNTQSFWRASLRFSSIPILLKDGSFDPGPQALDVSADGHEPAFDDSEWPRVRGPFFQSKHMGGWVGWGDDHPNTALIRLRGRFAVTDPAGVKSLTLNLRYRGGVAVYLNGREIGRGHMPEGEIKPATLATPYPDEAFVVPGGHHLISGGYGEDVKFKDRIETRKRSLTGLSIDPGLLREGANTLAISLHRAPYNEIATYKKDGQRRIKVGRGVRPEGDHWSTAGLISVDLHAVGDGVRPNVSRPPGFQVWNADPLLVTYDTDYGDAGVEPDPVRIVGTPNGRFAGLLVTGSDKPITGLKASVSDLAAGKGEVRIPASAVEVRYQLPAGDYMDGLSPTPPATVPVRTTKTGGQSSSGTVCPVWLTIHVPKDAPSGFYKGVCRIKADGIEPVEVPLHLTVCGWTLPPPHELRTIAGFHQSPESVAMHYNVPFWSDEHFRYLDESFRHLAIVGCKTVHLHLIEHTNLGNAESIVPWKRRKDAPAPEPVKEGELPKVTLATHEPDFTAADRYLDVALKHLVKPSIIDLYAWDNYCGTMYHGNAGSSHNVPPRPARVTEVVNGKARSADGPNYKNVAEAVAFWKPVAEHFHAYLEKRGLGESLLIGIGHDSYPASFVVETWKKLLPNTGWAFQGHPRPGSMYGVPIEYVCTVWQAAFYPRRPRGDGITYGWQLQRKGCHFDRYTYGIDPQTELLARSYMAGEHNITGCQRGFGRRNADLWPVLKDGRGRRYSLSNRYPQESHWGACNLQQREYLRPGPNGAIATGRLEMMAEGLQECEARIFIEEALLSDENRKNCGEDLVNRCHELLMDRIHALSGSTGRLGVVKFLSSGRHRRTRQLFALAGEVADAVDPKPNVRSLKKMGMVHFGPDLGDSVHGDGGG